MKSESVKPGSVHMLSEARVSARAEPKVQTMIAVKLRPS